MRQQYINLFGVYFHGDSNTPLYKTVRKRALYSLFIVVILGVIIQGVNFNFQNESKKLENEQNVIISSIINAQNNEAPINELVIRKKLLSQYLFEDVKFTTYYRLLQALLSAYKGVTLVSFTIDNKQYTAFSLAFTSYEDYLDFLADTNNQTFLKNFTDLSLDQISYDQVVNEQKYLLSFTGRFQAIADEKL